MHNNHNAITKVTFFVYTINFHAIARETNTMKNAKYKILSSISIIVEMDCYKIPYIIFISLLHISIIIHVIRTVMVFITYL